MRVLITGEKGYISNSLEMYLKNKTENLEVVKKSVRYETINKIDLADIDVIVHAAAIVHKKEANIDEKEYYLVNTELTRILAEKAKNAGVKHFIFFSTMAVFGNIKGCISDANRTNPQSLYGKSKFEAEKILEAMHTNDFKVAIVRPPMVYGPDCPGNYRALSKFSKMTPIFPNIKNIRSMIFVYNLTELIYQIIKNRDEGLFHPQDKDFINTSKMVSEIAINHEAKLILNSLLGNTIQAVFGKLSIYNKIFGNLYYSRELSFYRDNTYQKYCFKQSVLLSEKGILNEKII